MKPTTDEAAPAKRRRVKHVADWERIIIVVNDCRKRI
jgi:hypothetical protein